MSIQLTLAARYLMGRKLRTVLTTLAVIFGVLVLFGMNILLPTMIQAFEANVLAAFGQVDVTVTQITGEAFSPAVLDRVAAVDGVRAAHGFLGRSLNLPLDFFDDDPTRPDRVSTLSIVGLVPEQAQQVRAYTLAQGRFLHTGDEAAAVITTSLADALGLRVEDALTLPTAQGVVELTIVGLRPARTLPGNEEVLVTLAEAQALLDQPGQINTVEAVLNTTDEARRAEIQNSIASTLGEDYHLGALSPGTELFASLKIGQVAMSLFGFLALVMGGFIIFNTFRTVVAERKRDIAMLRAIGARRRTVVGVILAEGLLQGGIGTAIGMGLGWLLGASVIALASGVMEQFIHIRLGGPVISPQLVVITIALGVGTTLLAGLLPALNASAVSPLEALRPVAPEVQQRVARRSAAAGAVLLALAALGLASGNFGLAALGGLLFLCGLLLVAPALVKPVAVAFGALLALVFARAGTGTVAQANLARQPSRAAITASATMIGLAIIVASAGAVTSVSHGFLGVLRQSLGSDYLFIPPSIGVWASNVGANAGLAEELRAVQGVDVVSTMRFAATFAQSLEGTATQDTPVSLLGIDPLAFPQVSGLNFESGDEGAFAELGAGRNLIANGPMAAALRLKTGNSLRLVTPEGAQTYRVVAIAGDYLNAKIITGYVSQANLSADFHKTEDIFLQLNLANEADAAAVEPKLRAIAAEFPQFNLISGKAYYDENKRLFDLAFGGMYVLFGVLALPSLIALLNTLAIGVIERTREIGMLRAIGTTRKQVRRMVLAEALLLAALGTALGLVAGLYLGYVMVAGLSVAGYPLSYSFPLAGLAAAVAIGLLFGVLAALLPARQAARLEIVTALHHE